MIVYQCEDSPEGIFTAIYNAYEEKRNHNDTVISLTDELFLFAAYIKVPTDAEKAVKVMRTLERRFGEEDYLKVCFALTSEEKDKAQAVYQTVVHGLAGNVGRGHLFDNLACDAVHRAFALGRRASRECHQMQEFLRFQELEGNILYAKIGPENNILTFLMPHFADRFPIENFMIFDDNRGLLALHPAGRPWYLVRDSESPELAEKFGLSDKEREYQELFRYFCRKIAIKERKNLELQRNMLPLRFRDNMAEFEKFS